jgi:transposase
VLTTLGVPIRDHLKAVVLRHVDGLPHGAVDRRSPVRNAPGKQAQVDWGHLGYLDAGGEHRQVWGFAITLDYSRRMWAQAALDQKLGTLLRMHEAAFREMAGGGDPD